VTFSLSIDVLASPQTILRKRYYTQYYALLFPSICVCKCVTRVQTHVKYTVFTKNLNAAQWPKSMPLQQLCRFYSTSKFGAFVFSSTRIGHWLWTRLNIIRARGNVRLVSRRSTTISNYHSTLNN
jgi:hypothetical protein